jgi:hypothetical protein
MIIVDVFVPGAAKTKGSMEVRNRATGAMKESVAGSSHWRALMAQAVRDDIARRSDWYMDFRPEYSMPSALPYPGAVSVTVETCLPPPQDPGPGAASILRTWFRDAVEVWRRTGLPVWDRAGDLDKLVRNVLDALGSTSRNPKMNGGAIVDDNLVCRIAAWKHVADDRHPAGVRIVVETL